jgi:hypothetical protein
MLMEVVAHTIEGNGNVVFQESESEEKKTLQPQGLA